MGAFLICAKYNLMTNGKVAIIVANLAAFLNAEKLNSNNNNKLKTVLILLLKTPLIVIT